MSKDVIKVSSLKIKFDSLLDLIDNAIKKSRPIQIPRTVINQVNNNTKFLKWLQRHKIVELLTLERPLTIKKKSISSRKRKKEISLLLKALRITNSDIAKRFKVKVQTVQSYFKDIGKYNSIYLEILGDILKIVGVSKNTNLTDFPSFPIRIKLTTVKEKLPSETLEKIINLTQKNKLIRYVTGQKLGTKDLSILFP